MDGLLITFMNGSVVINVVDNGDQCCGGSVGINVVGSLNWSEGWKTDPWSEPGKVHAASRTGAQRLDGAV